MKVNSVQTDDAVLRELGSRIAGFRLARNLTQAALAEQAGISKRTLERMESGEVATQLSGFIRVCRALGLLAGFETLIPPVAPSPIAQLKLAGKRRQRAQGKRGTAIPRARELKVSENLGTANSANVHTTFTAPKKWTWGEK
jgi:transcriptional regulator with XRE-family HTH domain